MDDNYAQRVKEMKDRQRELQGKLGFEAGDDHQNWLRLHEILFDHEGRIRSIEMAKSLKGVKK